MYRAIRSIFARIAKGQASRRKAEADALSAAFRERIARDDTRGQHVLERPAVYARCAQLAAEIGRPLPKALATPMREQPRNQHFGSR